MTMNATERLIDQLNNRVLQSDVIGYSDIVFTPGDGRTIVVEATNNANKYDVRSELVTDEQYTVSGHPVELVLETFTSSRIEVVAVQMDLFDAEQFLTEWRNAPTPEKCPSFSLTHVEAVEQWGGIGRKYELEAKHVQDAFQEYRPLRERVADGAIFF